uniref:Probable spermidine putrescine ABC transporter permease protein n=1 Tax=Aureimonas frigidaquae TaxID=424757 RepID=A0A0P0Z3J6_9HYPH|nr:probable spermidine putrescine ABC transporter permease protein [Aureimonas frigidaquae]
MTTPEKLSGAPPSGAPARANARYAGSWGRLVASPTYRNTFGRLFDSRTGRLALLFSVPAIWLIVFDLGPVFQLVRISLMSQYPIVHEGGSALTLDNFRVFFAEPLYFTPLIRSVLFAFAVTAVTLLVVYPVAYYIAKIVRPENRTRALLLLLIPFWAGEIIRTYSVIMLLANRGAVNFALRELELITRPIPMLYNYYSLSFGIVYLVCLYMLLPLYSALEKIPTPLLHAAADLGAGPFTRFRRIVLPLSRDGIVSGCSLVFLTTIGVFATPILLGGPSTGLFPETIASFFHGASDRWPVGAAMSVVMLVLSLGIAGMFMAIVGRRNVRFM